MNITIFGSTGRTGILVVEEALKADYSVTALGLNASVLLD